MPRIKNEKFTAKDLNHWHLGARLGVPAPYWIGSTPPRKETGMAYGILEYVFQREDHVTIIFTSGSTEIVPLDTEIELL